MVPAISIWILANETSYRVFLWAPKISWVQMHPRLDPRRNRKRDRLASKTSHNLNFFFTWISVMLEMDIILFQFLLWRVTSLSLLFKCDYSWLDNTIICVLEFRQIYIIMHEKTVFFNRRISRAELKLGTISPQNPRSDLLFRIEKNSTLALDCHGWRPSLAFAFLSFCNNYRRYPGSY